MKLSVYLKRKKMTPAAFARLVGVAPLTVHRWLKGERFPLRHLAEIKSATGGSVTANDFAGDLAERTA